jgi:hypothetical protein
VPSYVKPQREAASLMQVIPVPAALGLALLFFPLQRWVPPDGVVMVSGPVLIIPS